MAHIVPLSKVEDKIFNLQKNGMEAGLKIGFPNLDSIYSVKAGTSTVIYGRPTCFTKNTMVQVENGFKKISELQLGELVKSFNHESNKIEFKPIINMVKTEYPKDKIFKIKLKCGKSIEVTENHEFWNGNSYVKIKDILRIFEENKKI